jgi:hypothetical protein
VSVCQGVWARVWRWNFFICAHIQQWALHNETKTGAAPFSWGLFIYILLSEGLCWNGQWIANNALISVLDYETSKAVLYCECLVSPTFSFALRGFFVRLVFVLHGRNSSVVLYAEGILFQPPLLLLPKFGLLGEMWNNMANLQSAHKTAHISFEAAYITFFFKERRWLGLEQREIFSNALLGDQFWAYTYNFIVAITL